MTKPRTYSERLVARSKMLRLVLALVMTLVQLAIPLQGATPAFASGEDYRHWQDLPTASWSNGASQGSNSAYFEGEVLPHYFVSHSLTAGNTYAFNIFYDYYYVSKNGCGFTYFGQYNTSRTPTVPATTPPAGAPVPDDPLPGGHGNFYTTGANITNVSAPINFGDGRLYYVQVTFTANQADVAFDWGFHLAFPNEIGTCLGAAAWPGASLQTYVSATPVVLGATMIGGGGTLSLNPNGVIAGSISGYKWSDLNGNGADNTEPKLSGWTIQLCSDSVCTIVIQSTVTDASGNYIFHVPPGTYYVREVPQGGWRQTAPTTVYYGPLVVNATTPTYSTENFGNQQLGSIIVNKTANGGNATFGFTTTGGDGLPGSFNITTSNGSGSQAYNNSIVPGTYSVSESPLTGWTLTGSSCTSGTPGSFTVMPGGTVTCSFTNLKQAPALTLTKSASPSTYDTVGQVIVYTYVVKNTGNVTLNGPFTVSDDKATDESCPATASLAPGASVTCSASYTISQADLDASSVTNTATATNGTVTSDPATATVYAVGHPILSLVKTATPANYDHVGQTISYSYVVKNIGNVALSAPFAVTDDKATVTCPQTPNPLPVGSSITCSASYAITQADLDAGSVTNHASATAKYGANTVTSNNAQATVNATQNPRPGDRQDCSGNGLRRGGRCHPLRLPGNQCRERDPARRDHGERQQGRRHLPGPAGRRPGTRRVDHLLGYVRRDPGRPGRWQGDQRRVGDLGHHHLQHRHRDRHGHAEPGPVTGQERQPGDVQRGGPDDQLHL